MCNDKNIDQKTTDGSLCMALYGSDGYCQCDLRSVRKFFNTFSTLYQAKDNDLLFAMPITERSVLTARLSGVYAMGLMYELFVLGSDMYSGLPTIIPSFIVLTIPMSHLRRKLCQQGLPQFLCLISIAQTWNPYPFVFCPCPGFSSFGAGMRLASFQERS